MPLKWRIYYLCSLYLLVWSVILLLFLSYVLFDRELKTTNDYLLFIFIFSLVSQLVFKSVLSIRGTSHYKNISLPSKKGRVLFIVTFIITAIFMLLVLAFCFFAILPPYFAQPAAKNFAYTKWEYEKLAFNFSVLVLALTGTFVSIFDLLLLKAIRKKYYDYLFVLGENIGEQLEN